MATSAVKAVRPNHLTENETLTSFEDWRNQLEFFLGQDSSFKPFLKPSQKWKKVSAAATNRGLTSADNLCSLQHFLGVTASLSPPLLHGHILNDTESLAEIYQLIRSYYHFAPSESTFIKFAALKRELNGTDLERPQHLYLRMRQFIRGNLLKKDGLICHDGNVPEEDETLSATTERLIVLRWLELLHPALPMHVANVFAHELQTKSLKDLQPLIVAQIDNLLQEVNQKEDFSSQISSTQAEFEQIDIKRIAPFKKYQQYRPNHYGSLSNRSNNYNRNLSYSQRNPPFKTKQSRRFITKCAICKAAGEPL